MADINTVLKNAIKKMEKTLKESDILTTSSTIEDINTFLEHKRCIFLTLEQYKNKAHINDKTYTNVSIVKDVKNHIIEHLKSVAVDAPFNKIPRPIYVMISKKLEYDEKDSMIFGKCSKEIGAYSNDEIDYETIDKNKPETYKCYKEDYDVSCFYDKNDKYNRNKMDIFKFINNNIGEDVEKLKTSSLSSYKFMGNYEVIISIPNLNKEKNFFTSYYDYYYQNMFYNLLVNENDFLNIIKIDKKIPEVFKKLIKDPEKYKKFVDYYNDISMKDYPLINDLTSICYDLGCTSDNGEDFQEIVPKISDNYEDRVNNAKGKAPYFPTKCLRTSYYKKNMIDYESDKYKIELINNLIQGIESYKGNLEKIENDEKPDKHSGDNIVDVLKNTAFKYRNTTYTGEDYSEDYNRKILSELAFRYNTVPGIQEMVFSVFKVDDSFDEINNITSIMPWGNMLLEKSMVLPEGEELDIDTNSIKSFNKEYEIKMFLNKLWLFKNNGLYRRIFDEDFSSYTKRKLIIENGYISIYGTDISDIKDNRFNVNIISNSKYKSPISLIIENDGTINIYDNGFNIVGRI